MIFYSTYQYQYFQDINVSFKDNININILNIGLINMVIAINKVIFESIDINQNINSDKKIFKNIAIDIDKGSRRLKKSRIL